MPDTDSKNRIEDKPVIEVIEGKYGQQKDISPVEDGNEANTSPKTIFSNAERRKLYWRVDMWVVPITTVLYLFSFIDRANIGNAKIEGLDVTLHLTPPQYNWCLTVFFFSYALFEIPCNILLKKMRPSIWLPGTMVAWGLIMLGMGFVKSYAGLINARFFLGMAEAGLKPGVMYYMSKWYNREEYQRRMAVFFSAAGVAGAFSGLLAYGISFMHMKGGLEGWRWIFIIEGIVTVVVAIIAFAVMVDYPDTAHFLTESEREYILDRLKHHGFRGEGAGKVEEDDEFSWPAIKSAFLAWQVGLGVLLFMACVAPLYGISLFLPTIIRDLGYKKGSAQLMTVPVYTLAACVSIAVAYAADKVGKRTPFLFGSLFVVMIGYIMCISTGKPGVVYAGVFFAAAGVYGAHPSNISLIANNLSPSSKRAAGIGIHFALGNLAGAMASNFYRAKDSPRYILGHALEIGFVTMGMTVAALFALIGWRINKDRQKRCEHGEHLQYSEQQLAEQGDKALTYRYML